MRQTIYNEIKIMFTSILVILLTLFMGIPAFAATESETACGTDTAANANLSSEAPDPPSDMDGIIFRNSKEKTVSVYIETTGGTKYNSSKTRKCVWTEKHYKVYYENVGTGKRRFAYDEYKWHWDGYKKSGSSWVFVKSASGTSRSHVDASDIGSWLLSFA